MQKQNINNMGPEVDKIAKLITGEFDHRSLGNQKNWEQDLLTTFLFMSSPTEKLTDIIKQKIGLF